MANEEEIKKINENVKKISEDGINVSFYGIKKLESNLSDVNDTTQHISETLDGSDSPIYKLLDKIREEATQIKTAIGTNNPHIESSGSTLSIQNASSGTQTLGGTSDIFNQMLSEIQAFHNDVLNILDLTSIISKNLEGTTAEEIASKMEKVLEGKDKAEKDFNKKKEEQKYSKEGIKAERERRKKEAKYNRKLDRNKNIAGAVGDVFKGIGSVAKGIKADDVVNGISGALSKAGPWGAVAGGAIQTLKALFDLYAKVDKEASDYARAIGGSKQQKKQIFLAGQRIADNSPFKYGINQEEIIKQAKETAEALGRNVSHISDVSLRTSLMLKKMGIETSVLNDFDTYGKNIVQTDRFFNDLYKQVSKKGLSFKNVAKSVNENLKSAQKYTFRDGLKGIERMAERSTQLKFNMQQAMTFADKISSFEEVIKTSANLSVLGGTFAAYSNPMQMMYEALNDVEALQSRMVKMYSDKAFWNAEKGQFEINAVDRQIMKQAANAMGIDAGEMISMSMNQAKFKRVESQIRNRGQFSDDIIEYIKNLSEIDENGNANITLNGKTTAVKDLTSKDADFIRNEQKKMEDAKAATMSDIYVHTKGIAETVDDLFKYITTKLGVWVAKLAGVGFDEKSDRWAWKMMSREQRDKLIKEYGSKKAAKTAVGMGQADEMIEDVLSRGGEINFDASKEFWNNQNFLKWFDSMHNRMGKFKQGSFDNEIAKIESNLPRHGFGNTNSFSGIVKGQKHGFGGNLVLINGQLASIEQGEGIISADAVSRYGLKNIKNLNDMTIPTISNIQGNNLNPLSVAPNGPSYGGAGKINFGDIKVQIGGKLDLTSGDKHRELDVTKLSSSDLEKISSLVAKQVYNQFMRATDKGYNKEVNPFRNA